MDAADAAGPGGEAEKELSREVGRVARHSAEPKVIQEQLRDTLRKVSLPDPETREQALLGQATDKPLELPDRTQ